MRPSVRTRVKELLRMWMRARRKRRASGRRQRERQRKGKGEEKWIGKRKEKGGIVTIILTIG